MKEVHFSAVRNALANLVRGGATAVVALALPRFLTRSLDQEHFAAWSLILQVAAYANYFDFGLQIAIGRFMAQAIELDQRERQAKMIGTSLFLLMLAAAFAALLISLVLWQLPHLFSGIGPRLLSEFRRACFILSLCTCLLLPLSTYTGVLIGMHRNGVPALAIGGSRIVGALAAILVARHTQALPLLALCIGVPNLLGGLAQMAAVRSLLEQSRSALRHVSRVVARQLFRFCASLTVWSLSALFINGLDLTIVGHFQFRAVGYYSLASMVIVFLIGLGNSLLSALLAPLSTLHARDDRPGMVRMLFLATRLTLLINLSFCAVVFFAGPALLRAWVGPVYAAGALPVLRVLTVAQTIRFLAGPLSTLIIATGEPDKALGPGIFESIVNVCASILGILFMGAIGVAWGTFAGALCGLTWMLTRVLPSLTSVSLHWRSFLAQAVLPASVPALPLLILWFARHAMGSTTYAWSLAVCLVLTGLLAWQLYKAPPSLGKAEAQSN